MSLSKASNKPPSKLGKKISSPKALFIFEAAARHLSFTAAAAELNVTAPAVSRMIAALEAHLQTDMFERRGSRLSLTENGVLFYDGVIQSFQSLERVIDRFESKKNDDNQITLSVTTGFVTYWLMPRLNLFRKSFPDVNLQYELTRAEPKGPISPCDLGTRYDTEAQREDQSWPFAPEWIFPLATPQYLQRHGSLDDTSSGREHILLGLANSNRTSWQIFADKTGFQLTKNHKITIVPDHSFAMQMALSGEGVALGFVSASATLMLNGTLVPASKKQLRTGHQFLLLAATKKPLSQTKLRVCHWLLSQMQEEIILLEQNFPYSD